MGPGATTFASVANSIGDPAQISYNNYDFAEAIDRNKLVGEIVNPTGSTEVAWQVAFTGVCTVHAYTVNAPDDPANGIYFTTFAAAVEMDFGGHHASNGVSMAYYSNAAGNTVLNASVQFLDFSDPASPSPYVVLGTGANHSATLEYDVGAVGELLANRPEVDVGGLAAATVSQTGGGGVMAAWDISDAANPVLMSKQDGTNAIWNFQ